MAQDDELRRYGLGAGMNQDDSPEDVDKNGDYISATNLRNTGTKDQSLGYNTNIENINQISGTLLPGINNVVGGEKFDETGQVLIFRYNTGGFNQILLYTIVTNTYQVIYTDITDSGGAILLPLNPQNEVKAKLFNKTYVIWWAKGLEVGYTNLITLAGGGYGPVVQPEDLGLLKPQCKFPITGVYGNDPGQPANYLYGKLPQFIAQYINADFNYSAWSTRSKRIVPYQQNTPVLGSNVGQNNYIIVSVNIGSIRASTLNVAVQFDDSGQFYQIKSIDRVNILALPNTSVNVPTEVLEAYDPSTNIYSFVFYNNTTLIPVVPTETDLGYDYIWQVNAGENVNGNLAALGDITTLYQRPKIDVSISASGYNPNIGIPVGALTDQLTNAGQFNGASGSGAGNHRRNMSISLSGTPHTGDTVIIIQADIRDANNTLPQSYTVPSAQDGNLAAVVGSISAILGGSFVNNSGVYTIFWTGNPYFGLQIFSIELFFGGAQVANSIPSFPDNTSVQLALAHFDAKDRYLPLDTDNKFIVTIPSYAQVNGNAISIACRINSSIAPPGAVRAQWLITKPKFTKILDTVASILNYIGPWNAATNTSPSLSINTGNIGDTYQITTPAAPSFPSTYHNLGNNATYNTGDYITNVGGSSGAGIGQSYAVLPKTFGNLAGKGGILAFSLNSLSLLNSEFSDENVVTNLVYDFAEGDRCTLHYWIGSAGAINTFAITPGTGYTNGSYTGVALTGGSGTGAIATVTVAGGVVTTVVLTNPGTGYTIGDVLTGTVTGGTGWAITVGSLVVNGINYFNNPCIDLAVLGYDAGTNIVKVENSAALVFSGSHILYNGQQIDARNIFMRLYSPQKLTQATTATQSTEEFFEIGEVITITNGTYDKLNYILYDGGVYYKTRQFPDSILPYKNPPISVLAVDLNYSDFYFSPYSSFGRVRTYYDELEATERQASIITTQTYIAGSKINGLNRAYPADIYGDGDGQTSSSKGGIQVMWQRGNVLLVMQSLGTFYIPVNEAYQQLNAELTGVAISEKLFNNGRYDDDGIGLGLTKCFCTRYSTGYGIDPFKSLPYEWTTGGIKPISGKMSQFFKSIIQLAYSQGKRIIMYYNDYYEEVVLCIQAQGGIIILFPFSAANWNLFSNIVITPGEVSATPNGSHSTASYNATTGIVTYTPTPGYSGADTATFTFNPGSGNITLNNCLNWISGNTTVNPFSFTPKTNQPLSTSEQSNSITVSGPNIAVPISITGDTGLGYSINGGAFTSAAGTVNSGDTVSVQVNSSGSNSTLTSCTLTIGSTSATFGVTTLASGGTTTPMSILSEIITGAVKTTFGLGVALSVDITINYSITYVDGGVSNFLGGGFVTILAGATTGFDTISFGGSFAGWTTITCTLDLGSPRPNPAGGTTIIYSSPHTDTV